MMVNENIASNISVIKYISNDVNISDIVCFDGSIRVNNRYNVYLYQSKVNRFEMQSFELKLRSHVDNGTILRYINGFVNQDGGTMLFGVHDNGTILGFRLPGIFAFVYI